jgi:hypothetical protein
MAPSKAIVEAIVCVLLLYVLYLVIKAVAGL